MKKRVKITLLVLLALVLLGGLVVALTPTRKLVSYFAPKIDNMRVTNARINEETATMTLLADVQPSLLSSVVDSMVYDFSLYGTKIAQGEKTFTQAEKSGKAQQLQIPMTMNHNVTRELVRRQVKEGGKVKAHLKAYTTLPLLGPQEVEVKEDLDLILPALPGQEVVDVQIHDLGLDNMEMTMTMLIDNPNHFDFYVKRYDVKMKLNDYIFTSGNLKKEYLVKAQSKTPIEVRATSDIKKPLKMMVKTIFGDKEWPYHLTTYAVLQPKSDVVGTVKIDGQKTGSIHIGKQLKKIKETNKAQKKAQKAKEEEQEEKEKQEKEQKEGD